MTDVIVLVRGIGDVGSAIAHRLFLAGYSVIIHASPQPTTTRRGMAFADAVVDGQVELAGMTAVRVDDLGNLPEVLASRTSLPVVVAGFEMLLGVVLPDVLIDARMRKRARPEVQRGLGKLTIGLGPGFVAGATTDLAVETSWGDRLGQVVTAGSTLPLAGEPRPIAGHARDRYVYAPVNGVFHTKLQIGDVVKAGDEVARIDRIPLTAPIDGALRGLTRDSVPVSVGTKVIEVDPRGTAAEVRGIGERPRRIAEGVLRAVSEWAQAH